MGKSKLIYGVAINDGKHKVSKVVNGKNTKCPFYSRWLGLIRRCYDPGELNRQLCYRDCVVCDSWLNFSSFREWMELQNWEGLELDKDIIKPGNKVYCPEYCRFVSRGTNALLNDHGVGVGPMPVGVGTNGGGRYFAQMRIYPGRFKLGTFGTPKQAHKAYAKAKAILVLKVAELESDRAISLGLVLHAKRILNSAFKL